MSYTALKLSWSVLLVLTLLTSPLAASSKGATVNLAVPFTSEIPDGLWVKPWNNACEEASITVVEKYYWGQTTLTKAEAKKRMWSLFEIEDKIFGSNADTDATRTAKLINQYTDFSAKIKDNPTLDDIKNELKNGRPVISFHHGKKLANPDHRWRQGGSYYHVMVITGFDDDTKEFLVNDSADRDSGLDYRYKYDIILSTLHDFNHKTKKANGPARVLFTESKALAKTKDGNRIYLINHDTKQYVAHPSLIKKHGWRWDRIKTVDKKWLEKLKSGPPIIE